MVWRTSLLRWLEQRIYQCRSSGWKKFLSLFKIFLSTLPFWYNKNMPKEGQLQLTLEEQERILAGSVDAKNLAAKRGKATVLVRFFRDAQATVTVQHTVDGQTNERDFP